MRRVGQRCRVRRVAVPRRGAVRYRYMPSQSAMEVRRKRRVEDARRAEFDRQSLEEVLSVLARWSSGTGSRDAATRVQASTIDSP